MPDNFGDQREQKQAITNFEKCLRPGGLLCIDHRNYDSIMETGTAPSKSIYYNVSFVPRIDFSLVSSVIGNELECRTIISIFKDCVKRHERLS